MKVFIIRIDNKFLKDFETRNIKDEMGTAGWTSIRKTFELTCPMLTTYIDDAKEIEGNINLKSCVDKILHWLKETDEMMKMEIIDLDLILSDSIEDWAGRK